VRYFGKLVELCEVLEAKGLGAKPLDPGLSTFWPIVSATRIIIAAPVATDGPVRPAWPAPARIKSLTQHREPGDAATAFPIRRASSDVSLLAPSATAEQPGRWRRGPSRTPILQIQEWLETAA
jgi:hypothetical protein